MATALLGPLTLGWIDYHVSLGAAGQLRGGDIARLVLVGPVALPPPGSGSQTLSIVGCRSSFGADRSRIRSASESARAVAVC
jgi:hypothetical protein